MGTKADSRTATLALANEVARRNEWYGLDNWTFPEVVEFVLTHAGVAFDPVPNVKQMKHGLYVVDE